MRRGGAAVWAGERRSFGTSGGLSQAALCRERRPKLSLVSNNFLYFRHNFLASEAMTVTADKRKREVLVGAVRALWSLLQKFDLGERLLDTPDKQSKWHFYFRFVEIIGRHATPLSSHVFIGIYADDSIGICNSRRIFVSGQVFNVNQ